jgi:hypothetical protein
MCAAVSGGFESLGSQGHCGLKPVKFIASWLLWHQCKAKKHMRAKYTLTLKSYCTHTTAIQVS